MEESKVQSEVKTSSSNEQAEKSTIQVESKNIQGSKISTQAGGNIKQKQENMYSCLEEYKVVEQRTDLQVGEYK